MKRREFLKVTTASLAANYLQPWGLLLSAEDVKPVVWEAQGLAPATIQQIFTAIGGLEQLIPADRSQVTVIIKPNLCLPHPSETGTTTSLALVTALADFLLENGVGKIIISDHTLQESSAGWQHFELLSLAEKNANIKIILANQQRLFTPVAVTGKVLKQVELLKMVPRADLLINLATAKHHSATRVSLALKNLMGLVWDRSEFHTRLDLNQAIADLALVVRPGLNLVDASRVLLNGGPTGPGPIITENRLFASYDILALDAVVASRYNFGGHSNAPEKIPHLQAAYQNGVGEIDLKKIQVVQLGG